MDEFQSISPYTDEEAVKALTRVSWHPAMLSISKYLFPNEPANLLGKMLREVRGVDDFQHVVMTQVIDSVLSQTSMGVSCSGIENLKALKGRFLLVSNHRDIVLDPAIIQCLLAKGGVDMTEICVGNNLLSSQLVEDLMRSNRMIKVIRGISARELYLSSQLLSKYIRTRITSGEASVWIAQKEGRTKNGLDATEQGLLKMFDMSGTKTFSENFEELNIVPVSISYEYEPCDWRKARELLISRSQKYVKKKNEDLHSILTGIRQWKGRISIVFNEPLTHDEIERAGQWRGNDRYQAIRRAMDRHIIAGYKLWPTNYIAFDLVNGTHAYADMYTEEEVDKFIAYMEHKIAKIETKYNRDDLRDIFLHIYSNPVENKRKSALEL